MKRFYHSNLAVIFIIFFLAACAKTPEIPYEVKELGVAINQGNVERVKKVIARGTDVNAKMSEGWTPLTNAAYHGHLEIVQILIRSGADINGRKDSPLNGDGRTPLMIASGRGHIDIVKFLLENGADTELKDRGGKTAAMFAANAGRKEILNILNSKKVSTNFPQGSSS
jgi:ankyrin repeat protein